MPSDATGRPAGRTPQFARNQEELGRYLIPPRDRKIIQRAMRKPGCPGRSNRGYEILPWQEHINIHFGQRSHLTEEEATDKRSLEIEKLKLQNEKLEFELSTRKKDYILVSDVKLKVAKAGMQQKRIFQSLPAKWAPVCAGLTEAQAEQLFKTDINAALNLLVIDVYGDDTEPEAPPSNPVPAAVSSTPEATSQTTSTT